jgi:hypothetical protein
MNTYTWSSLRSFLYLYHIYIYIYIYIYMYFKSSMVFRNVGILPHHNKVSSTQKTSTCNTNNNIKKLFAVDTTISAQILILEFPVASQRSNFGHIFIGTFRLNHSKTTSMSMNILLRGTVYILMLYVTWK